MSETAPGSEHIASPREDGAIVVFLVDDQAMIGEAVRRMLASQSDIVFHACRDATAALDEALRIKPTVILQDLVMIGSPRVCSSRRGRS